MMKDENKTKEQLIEELVELRQQVAESQNRLMVISTAIESQLLAGTFDTDQLKRAESSVDQSIR